MATFIMFGRYSKDSAEKISAQRTQQTKDLIRENGGELKTGYAILGKTDLILIVDFPSTKNAMKASVGLSKLLGISFSTSPAVTIDEFDQMMG